MASSTARKYIPPRPPNCSHGAKVYEPLLQKAQAKLCFFSAARLRYSVSSLPFFRLRLSYPSRYSYESLVAVGGGFFVAVFGLDGRLFECELARILPELFTGPVACGGSVRVGSVRVGSVRVGSR